MGTWEGKIENKKSGFTLFELVIVIVIISVLTGLLTPIVSTAIKGAQRSATENRLESLNQALLLYYDCKFDLPTNLTDLAPNYIRSSKYANDYTEDAWRKVIVYTKSDSKTATLLSYGPNRVSGGGDDITYNVTSMSIYRKYKKQTQDELRAIDKAAEDYVRDGNSLSSSTTSETIASYLPGNKYEYDPWGRRAAPGMARALGQPYHYDANKKTFYSYGPNGVSAGGDDIYPAGVPE